SPWTEFIQVQPLTSYLDSDVSLNFVKVVSSRFHFKVWGGYYCIKWRFVLPPNDVCRPSLAYPTCCGYLVGWRSRQSPMCLVSGPANTVAGLLEYERSLHA